MSVSITRLSVSEAGCMNVTDDPRPLVKVDTEGLPDEIRIQVFSSSGCLFDSGRQPYSSPYFSLDLWLHPKTGYHVFVTVYQGSAIDSSCLCFETGFLGTPWKAKWIEPKQQTAVKEDLIHFYEIFRPFPEPEDDGERLRPGQLLQKSFYIKQFPEKARLYATAHGIYHLQINGKDISPARLSPEITPYQKYLFYQTFDILPYLKTGKNELLCELCDGWWIGRIGLSGDSCQYGSRLGFLAQIELDHQIIYTDESWKCRQSHIQYADLYIGEKWDLCKKESPWNRCMITDDPCVPLFAQPIPPVQPLGELAGQLYESANGELIADFGQVLAGVVHLEANLTRQSEIILEHSETVDQEGNFFKNIIGRNKQQRDKITAPQGALTFEPRHTYHGFRYVRIHGITKDEISSISAIILGTPLKDEGTLTCSDPRINQLQKNIQWSLQSNMVSIPTDCPQREKMGWTGDIQVFTRTGCFNKDLLPFLSSWLKGLRSEQLPNGEIPLISPDFPRTDAMQREIAGENTSSAWGDACILVPYYLYLCTGDTRVLEDNLPMMESWLDFVAEAAARRPDDYDSLTTAQKNRTPYLWQSGHHFGDWMIPSMSKNPDDISKASTLTGPVIASFFYAVSLNSYIGVLKALKEQSADDEQTKVLQKKQQDAEYLLSKVRRAAGAEYISKAGIVKGNLQGVYVLALYSGCAEGTKRKNTARQLVKMIQKNGGHLDTGFVSTPYLLDVLYDNGYSNLAYQLLMCETPPSWLYMVKQGATSIWENWQAIQSDGTVSAASMNHYALGSVGDFIYRHIGGIEACEPGYRKIRFSPDPNAPVSWSRCTKLTAFGEVLCAWHRTKKGIKIELQTPVDAELSLPGRKEILKAGSYSKYYRFKQ